MMTRCFSPPLSVWKPRSARCRVPVDSSASNAVSMSLGVSDFERAQMRISSHERDLEDAVVEGQCVSCGTTAHRRATNAAASETDSRHRAGLRHVGGQRPRQQPQQRRLARSVGTENPDERASRDLERHAVDDEARGPGPRAQGGTLSLGLGPWALGLLGRTRTSDQRLAATRTPIDAVRPSAGKPNTSS